MRFHFAAIPVHGGADAEQALHAFLGLHRVLDIGRHLIAEPDQTAVASGGSGCRRTPQGPRCASSGSGCAVERSPGLRLSRSPKEWP
jgi:hypothetical protein